MPDKNTEKELLLKLDRLLSELRSRDRTVEFDLNSLFDRVQPRSLAALSMALGTLVHEGRARLVYRVMSPSGGGLAEFDALEAIPSRLEDRFADWREIEVTPELVVPVYQFP